VTFIDQIRVGLVIGLVALAGCSGSTTSTGTSSNGSSGATGPTGSAPEAAQLCANPRLVKGEPTSVVVLLDGVGSTEPNGGTFYPVPVKAASSGVPVVSNYCPLSPDGSEREFPAGLNDSLHRWSEFNAPGGSSGSSGPAVSQACDRTSPTSPGGFGKGACLTEALADVGAVLLP
jgi:hypothetical protein